MPYGHDSARLRALKGNFGTVASTNNGASANVYVALLRSASSPATVLGSEPTSAGNYARVSVSNVDASFTFGSAKLENANEIRWPTATAVYSITDALNQWAIYDNSAGGNCIAFGELTTPITVTGSGDTPVIAAGNLDLTQA